jgi:hypothetical protein
LRYVFIALYNLYCRSLDCWCWYTG